MSNDASKISSDEGVFLALNVYHMNLKVFSLHFRYPVGKLIIVLRNYV